MAIMACTRPPLTSPSARLSTTAPSCWPERYAYRGKRHLHGLPDPLSSPDPRAYTIGDQIAEVLKVHNKGMSKLSGDRSIELMRMVGIPSPADRLRSFPHEFSGWYASVMIAMAIANDLACSSR